MKLGQQRLRLLEEFQQKQNIDISYMQIFVEMIIASSNNIPAAGEGHSKQIATVLTD